MALDPRIILAGQAPDTMGAFSNGLQTGALQTQIGRQNALADLYRTQGAGIMAGDTGALNALAGLDPMAAMDVQKQRLGMDATRLGMDATRHGMRVSDENLNIARTNAKMRADEFALQMDEAQRRQAKEDMARASAVLTQVKTPEQFAQVMATPGAKETVERFLGPGMATFENLPLIIASSMGIGDAMAMAAGPVIPSGAQALAWRAKQAGLQPGTPEYAEFMMTGGKSDGLAVDVDPATGAVSVRQGAGAGKAVKLTEAQSKDNVFATRAAGALEAFEPVSEALTSFGQRAAEADPTGVVRGNVQTPEFQVAKNAGDEFLQAILRKDTGAAITAPEQELYGKTYLPQPGDGPAVLAAKRQARARALAAMQSGMSPDQVAMTERALIEAARKAEQWQDVGGGIKIRKKD